MAQQMPFYLQLKIRILSNCQNTRAMFQEIFVIFLAINISLVSSQLIPSRPDPEIESSPVTTSTIPSRAGRTTILSHQNGSDLATTEKKMTTNNDDALLSLGDSGAPVFKNQKINGNISVKGFCGYPPYSDRQACITQNYYKDNLSQCEIDGGVIVFCCLVVLLGILIIAANVLLPLVVWKNPDMRTRYDIIKVSLAFADMLMGILLVAAVLPNVIHIRNLPLAQAVQYVENDTNSASAIVTGSIQVVSTQASVLHLMFLSIERLIAIQWPFWWKMKRRTSTVAITIAGIWVVSVLLSFMPAAFSKYFEYKLQPALLMHAMTLKELSADENGGKTLGYQGPLYQFFSLILPYSITIVCCILTGIVAYRKLTSRVRKFNKVYEYKGHSDHSTNEQRNTKMELKPEIFIFVTTTIMILAFTITLLPFIVVMILFVVGQLDCSNYMIPYVVAFYIGVLNSLANPFIYTLRDEKFRSAIRVIFSRKTDSSKHPTKTTSLPGSSQSTQLQSPMLIHYIIWQSSRAHKRELYASLRNSASIIQFWL